MTESKFEDLKNNGVWCSKLWTHQYFDPTGRVKPCCRFFEIEGENNLNKKPFEEIFFGEWTDSVRSRMLKGEKVPGCQRCYEEEDAGKKRSLRQNYNRLLYLPSEDLLDLNNPKLRYIELAISNDCNLKCRMCDSRYASKWFNDELLLSNETFSSKEHDKINVDLFDPYIKDIHFIKFTGGEPLMTKDYFRVLDKIIQAGTAKNVWVNISTNCTIMPTKKHIDQWKQFRGVHFNLSLDAIGKPAGYMRHPIGWKRIEKTILRFMELKDEFGIRLGLRSTISFHNIWQMPQVLDWWFDNLEKYGYNSHQGFIDPTHLTFPVYLSARVLPERFKEKITKELLSYTRNAEAEQSLKQLCSYMNAEDNSNLLPTLKSYTMKLDKIRNENFYETFPYYETLFDGVGDIPGKWFKQHKKAKGE